MEYVKLPSNSLHQKKAKQIIKKFAPFLVLAALVISIALWIVFDSSSNAVFRFISQGGANLKSSDGKVSVLLLGNAGGVHDGAYLTDTMLVASYNLKTNQVYLVSLPRDLWLDSTKSKINAVYEVGDTKGNGLGLDKKVVEEILGIPINYAVRIDFRGFVQAIDQLGGVDVNIDQSFDDYRFPIEGRENDLCGFTEKEMDFSADEAKKLNIDPGKRRVLISPDGQIATDSAQPDKGEEYFSCRYKHITFQVGLTHMDGITALNFVRSRKGTNGEGSDFARSKRQEKVIEATRKKALSFETLANPVKVAAILKTLGNSFETDMSVTEGLEFYKLAKKVDQSHSFVLSSFGDNSLLMNPPLADYGGAWVLLPKGGNYNEIHQFVRQTLAGEVTNDEATTSARTSGN